ncbi:MAG: hypothetical protein SOU50_00770 [Oscillospiraceae bacterium]|nr:hypothetical protein [Oscillospiraceae bacterium]MDY2846737.1 hypothetical protein [Oscillospiraceae bacterium]
MMCPLFPWEPREGCISLLFGYEQGFEQIVRHVAEFHGANQRFVPYSLIDVCFCRR